MFYSPLAEVIGSTDKVLNEEAASLFQEDKEGFSRRIKQDLSFIADLDCASPYRVQTVDTWTPELQALLDKLKSLRSPFEVCPDDVSVEKVR